MELGLKVKTWCIVENFQQIRIREESFMQDGTVEFLEMQEEKIKKAPNQNTQVSIQRELPLYHIKEAIDLQLSWRKSDPPKISYRGIEMKDPVIWYELGEYVRENGVDHILEDDLKMGEIVPIIQLLELHPYYERPQIVLNRTLCLTKQYSQLYIKNMVDDLYTKLNNKLNSESSRIHPLDEIRTERSHPTTISSSVFDGLQRMIRPGYVQSNFVVEENPSGCQVINDQFAHGSGLPRFDTFNYAVDFIDEDDND